MYKKYIKGVYKYIQVNTSNLSTLFTKQNIKKSIKSKYILTKNQTNYIKILECT